MDGLNRLSAGWQGRHQPGGPAAGERGRQAGTTKSGQPKHEGIFALSCFVPVFRYVPYRGTSSKPLSQNRWIDRLVSIPAEASRASIEAEELCVLLMFTRLFRPPRAVALAAAPAAAADGWPAWCMAGHCWLACLRCWLALSLSVACTAAQPSTPLSAVAIEL